MQFSFTDPYYAEKVKAQDALYKVIDPELFVNVVDLGLIYDVSFVSSKHIRVTMTLSTPHCPMGEAITGGVQNALQLLFENYEVEVCLTFDPAWNFEMLTAEGKAQLGLT